MRKVVIVLFSVLAITACTRDRVKISGRIANAGGKMLHLDEVDVYNTIPADSVALKKNGKFSFTFKSTAPGFYQLRLSPEEIIVLFPKPGEHLVIEADAGRLVTSLKVTGSHDTEQITKLMGMLSTAKNKLDSIALLYDKVQNDSLKNSLNKEYQKILDNHRKASIAYVITNYKSLSSVYALYQQYRPGYYVFYKTTDLQYFKILSDSLAKYHPGSRHAEALKAYTSRLLSNYNTNLLLQKSDKATTSLPPIALPDIAGDTATLASVKGKYILLSFWSSSNQDCVSQNLALKKVYQKFRKKGFEIFQVSFDNSRETWQRAVRFDELPWISVLDAGYPNSIIAGNYNVTELPANYLIDKGKSSILAKNLTPTQLENRLQELFN